VRQVAEEAVNGWREGIWERAEAGKKRGGDLGKRDGDLKKKGGKDRKAKKISFPKKYL
jgi:hypothetical protein